MQLVAIVVSIAVAVVGIALFVRAIRQIIAVAKMGQPAHRTDNPVARVKTLLKESLGHTRMLQWSWVGAGHWFIMVGFGLLFFTLVTAFGQLFDPHFALPLIGHFFLWEWVSEVFTFVMLIAIVAFIYYRATRPKERTRGPKGRFWGSTMWQGYFVEGVILGVGLCIAVLRGLEYALLTKPGAEHDASILHFPLSFPLGKAFEGLTTDTIENLIYLVAMLKILISFGWMITISLQPTMGVAWHRFLAFFNIYFKRNADGRTALGGLAPMTSGGKVIDFEDLEDMDEDTKLGVGAIEDFSWKGLLDFNTCTECGRCQSQCPAWNTEKPLSPKLLITAMRDHAYAKAPYVQAAEGDREALLEGNPALKLESERPLVGDTGDDWFYNPESGAAVIDPDVLWSCTSCGACVQQCPVDIEHVDHIVDMRRYAVLVESNFPTELNGLFKGLENKGNPWNMSPNARLDWAKDLPFEVKVVGEDIQDLDEVEWLFWVGCAGAYEDRAKKTTRAVAELLDMAGVSFGVLGNGETCTGDPARRAGNEFVFQGLATQNAEVLKEAKAKKVVSTCAHCFNTLKNEYAAFGVELEVVHHTQLLNRLVREKKLTPVASNGGGDKRSITYHDPCYIGRHNGVYSPPRELLNVIPDAELTEMPRNSERSFCCGAGGARMWMEENIGERININRTKEAVDTGADQIAVGCPFCRVMLSDGLTSQQSKGEAREEVEVLDVAQLLLASVKGESKPAAKKSATATATIEREDEETKAEPEAGDTTQTENTVTDTEDVGPLAKASGGSSLFDAGDDDSEPEPKTEPEPEPEHEKAVASAGGGSLFDLGGDDEPQAAEPEAKTAEPEPTAATSEPEKEESSLGSGSLFDLGGDEEPKGEDPAGDSTTDGTTDRSQDAADTDVSPNADQAAAGEAAAEDRADEGAEDGAVAVAEEPAAQKTASEPAAASSATASTPGTEIPEGGSLFDLEAPAEETISRPGAAEHDATSAPASDTSDEPRGEDPAGDSTTDGPTDRSQDAADTDVSPDADDAAADETAAEERAETSAQAQPGTSAETEHTPASTSSASGSSEGGLGGKYPAGTSMFDVTPRTEKPADTAAATEPGTVSHDEPVATEPASSETAEQATAQPEPQATEDAPAAESAVTSLRDIKAKFSGGSSADDSASAVTSTTDSDTPADQTSEAAATEEESDASEESAGEDATVEEKPKPAAGSGEAHQPKTEGIDEASSLFDL